MATNEMFSWREPEFGTTDFTGFEIEARDGSIGKVDELTKDAPPNCLVVDTGPWILGKHVMLPAGTILSVDHDEGKLFVDMTKDEIKDAPEFTEERLRDEGYRKELGRYYESRTPHRTPTRR